MSGHVRNLMAGIVHVESWIGLLQPSRIRSIEGLLHVKTLETPSHSGQNEPNGYDHKLVGGVSLVRILVPSKARRVEVLMYAKSVKAQ
ncbi:hypothetical protein TNCV_4383831 [Trichonephila clavipes]|nr:hypothetical protein TNCV_4383831 [Trichonephila clavipes]